MKNYINLAIENPKKRTKRAIIVAAVIFVIIALMATAIIYHKVQKDNYIENMKEVNIQMSKGGEQATELCILAQDVWYDSIHNKKNARTITYTDGAKDFNQAIKNFYDAEDTKTTMKQMRDNQKKVADLIDQLENPPASMEKYHNVLLKYYESYKKLMRLTANPKGSYKEYKESVKLLSGTFYQLQRETEEILPDKAKL